jgi:teichuronic acid biosynthesis glycosyltransferase TuaG
MDAEFPLVSVIMPVFNGSAFIYNAIQSVREQDYAAIELLVINDGSADNTEEIVLNLLKQDPRIKYFWQLNQGVSSARNVGLSNMRGDFFCFLDADDVMPTHSIQARVAKFIDNPKLEFVDGIVNVFDSSLKNEIRRYKPDFTGNPISKLLILSDRCFFGPSWMIRRRAIDYHMKSGLTHGEDLLFYLELSRSDGLYDYVDTSILHYRHHAASAMRNVEGLWKGYNIIYREVYCA